MPSAKSKEGADCGGNDVYLPYPEDTGELGGTGEGEGLSDLEDHSNDNHLVSFNKGDSGCRESKFLQ